MTDAPRYRLVGYDIGTAPDENGGWVHWTDHKAIVARLTAERDRFEAALGRACLVGGTTYLLERAEKAEAERDAALAGVVKVKPLVWPDFRDGGTCGHPHHFQYFVRSARSGECLGSIARFPTIEAAKAAAQTDYDARILAAIQPDPEARQADLAKAWEMGRDAAAETADDCRRSALAGMGMGPVLDAIRALTPPADLAAKIGGEE